jgi:hypothetical protein
MTIDEVVQFMKDFIQAEYECLIARHSEPDDQKFLAAYNRVVGFFSGATVGGLTRPPMTAADFARFAPQLQLIKPRILFKVKSFDYPELGELHAAWTGSTAGTPSYYSLFLIRPVDSRPRIVAEYGLCLECSGRDPDCSYCSAGWSRSSGLRLDFKRVGSATDVRKLSPPQPAHERATYDADDEFGAGWA